MPLIQILGPGCPKCQKLAENAEAAAADAGVVYCFRPWPRPLANSNGCQHTEADRPPERPGGPTTPDRITSLCGEMLIVGPDGTSSRVVRASDADGSEYARD